MFFRSLVAFSFAIKDFKAILMVALMMFIHPVADVAESEPPHLNTVT